MVMGTVRLDESMKVTFYDWTTVRPRKYEVPL